jgi:hypothetical protein
MSANINRNSRLEGEFVFHDVEDELGVGPFDVGDGKDFLDEGVEVAAFLEVGNDERIPVACDVIDRLDVGVFGYLLLDLDELASRYLDVDDCGECVAELFLVDDWRVARDDLGVLEAFDVAGDGGETDVEGSGDITEALPSVIGKLAEDLLVQRVHRC